MYKTVGAGEAAKAVEVVTLAASAAKKRRRRAVQSAGSLVAGECPRGAAQMGWVEKGEEGEGLVRKGDLEGAGGGWRMADASIPGSGKWRLSAPTISISGILFPRSLHACVMFRSSPLSSEFLLISMHMHDGRITQSRAMRMT